MIATARAQIISNISAFTLTAKPSSTDSLPCPNPLSKEPSAWNNYGFWKTEFRSTRRKHHTTALALTPQRTSPGSRNCSPGESSLAGATTDTESPRQKINPEEFKMTCSANLRLCPEM